MPTFDTAPADPLDYALVNDVFDGVVPGQNWSSLNALEATNVEDGKLTQRAVNVRSCVQRFGPVAAVYTRDFKASAFSEDAPSLHIPGASLTFELMENCSRVQFMYQLSWQGLISPPQGDGGAVMNPDNDPQVAKLWIKLDGNTTPWQTSHRLPYSVSRLTWGGSRGKASPFDVVGPAGSSRDVDPARQRTVCGFINLADLRDLSAGVHHVGLAVWYSGPGIVRIRSSQVAVIARYR